MLRRHAETFFLAATCCLVICFAPAVAQKPVSDGWLRVSSDDGAFSIDVPAKHRFFADREGFEVSKDGSYRSLKNMWMLSSLEDRTLVSFEVYEGDRDAMKVLYGHDAFAKDGRKVHEFKREGIEIKEIINSTDRFYCVRQFLTVGKHVIVLTTASRVGETPVMKRFLGSMKARDAATSLSDSSSTSFSKLKVTPIGLALAGPGTNNPKTVGVDKPIPEPGVIPFVMLRAARPSFSAKAREQNVSGIVILRLTLGADGFVSKVDVIQSPSNDLLRQAFFAAIRTKFLPTEKDDLPVETFTKLEFTFSVFGPV